MPNPQQEALLNQYWNHLKDGALDAAIAAGERLLDDGPGAEAWEGLLTPIRQGGPELYHVLHRVETYRSAAGAPWLLHFRIMLLERLEWIEEAFAATAELSTLPDRYAWMMFNRAGMLRNLWVFEEAKRIYEATLQAAPSFWKAAACLAETFLCQGREPEAMATIDACIARIPERSVRLDLEHDLLHATTWRGEMRLWMGRYAEALADFDAAANRNVQLALGWRGAAHLLLGDSDRALVDLDKAVELSPWGDAEALVWRAEVRLRRREWNLAIADYDRAEKAGSGGMWVLVGRALAKMHAGDVAGFWADFDRLPSRLIRFLQWKYDFDAQRREVSAAVAALEGALASARGLRRPEGYLFPLWMKR